MFKKCRFYHGLFVKVVILRQKTVVRVLGENSEDLFIRNPPFHKIGLGLDGNTTLDQAGDYAMAREVLIEDEDQAARCSISQRRASSTTGISRSTERFPLSAWMKRRELIKETRTPLPSKKGRLERHDYEYERCGVYAVFLASEPLAGKRLVKATERKTRFDWAEFVKDLAEHYKKAKKIILVMDNLSTHKAGSLYETFSPEEANKLRERFEFVYTPHPRELAQHGRDRIERDDSPMSERTLRFS